MCVGALWCCKWVGSFLCMRPPATVCCALDLALHYLIGEGAQGAGSAGKSGACIGSSCLCHLSLQKSVTSVCLCMQSLVENAVCAAVQVFKRISTLAVRALLHFNKLQAAHTLLAPTTPDGATDGAGTGSASSSSGSSADGVALEALLLWLACFQDLFSRPCVVSGKVLTWAPGTATPLPPYVRPFW